MSWAHGQCQCDGHKPEDACTGPAAYNVARPGGAHVNVCTRCTLPGDKEQVLLVSREDSLLPLEQWDKLGWMLVLMELMLQAGLIKDGSN